MSTVWGVDWYDANSERNYPLMDGMSRYDSTGSYQLDNGLLLDFVMPVNLSLELDFNKFHLYSVVAFPGGIVIAFGYDGTQIGAVSVMADTHTPQKAYYMQGMGDFSDSTATVVVGDISEALQAGGAFTFSADTAQLAPTTIRPALSGVSSVSIYDGTDSPTRYTGDIELYPGRNIQLTAVPISGGYRIRFDAVSDAELSGDCACSGEITAPILTICGVPGDQNNNMQLIPGSSCLDIMAQAGKLVLDDTCSEPCCTCDDLEPVRTDVNTIRANVETALAMASQLIAGQQELSLKLVAGQLRLTNG
jgi:hypothetical protein